MNDITVDASRALAAGIAKQKESKGKYFELDVTLSGVFDSAPDEPSVNYTGWTEIVTITINGLEFDAREFPAGFVKQLEGRL